MNREEKLKILEAAEARAYTAIQIMDGPDMASEGFIHLLHAVDQLRWMKEILENPDRAPCPELDFTVTPKEKEPVKLDPLEQPTPVAEDKPEPEPETPTITKQQMVTKLTAFQSNGVAIDLVMKEMGYDKLSQVPADRYWELLERCQKIADGEG